MDTMNLVESLFRWTHVVMGIIWIGHLYFFNWVNSNFAATMDAETKKKVVPELMPRALYFFRWGAAWTWITGLVLASMVYYQTKLVFADPPSGQWGAASIGMILVVILAFVVYDPLMKAVKDTKAQAAIGFVLTAGVVFALKNVAGFGFRGTFIHIGAMFGTIMAANVWMRIWPSQRLIITAIKNGEKPDPAVVAIAGLRSKHNTYMSVPLVMAMISQHGTWAASSFEFTIPALILLGWAVTFWVYKKGASVKGF